MNTITIIYCVVCYLIGIVTLFIKGRNTTLWEVVEFLFMPLYILVKGFKFIISLFVELIKKIKL